MKTYNIEVFNHTGAVLSRHHVKADTVEDAHRQVAKIAMAQGVLNFSVRDVDDEAAAEWPTPLTQTAAQQLDSAAEQKQIDAQMAVVMKFFEASSAAVTHEDGKPPVLHLRDAHGKDIIEGTLENLYKRAAKDQEKSDKEAAKAAEKAAKPAKTPPPPKKAPPPKPVKKGKK